MAISFDVIFHLVEDDVYLDYLDKLEDASNKNLLIYSTDYDRFEKSAHVRHRLYSEELENRGGKKTQALPAIGLTNLLSFSKNKFLAPRTI